MPSNGSRELGEEERIYELCIASHPPWLRGPRVRSMCRDYARKLVREELEWELKPRDFDAW